ncbi:MAG: hypothetical protein KF887_04620 [Paracoccaceae bacterium]|nr:MAG: hypothetical protein KF887_04620 [Paracoccaceae bacterium]
MHRPGRLLAAIDAAETRGAAIATSLAAELRRPTAQRARLASLLTDFRAAHAEASALFLVMRDAMGRAARREPGFPDAARIKRFRTRMRLWPLVISAVEDCAAGREWPLVPLHDPLDPRGYQAAIVSEVFTLAHRAINPATQDAGSAAHGCYPDIALDAAWFMSSVHLALRVLHAQKRAPPHAFLDVGCGSGMKVAMAAEVFLQADGLEYDAGYVEVATRAFAAMPSPRAQAFQADGLTYDRYGDYDVIYFFQPMSNADALLRLEEQIVQGARPGAVLIAPYQGFVQRAPALGCGRIADVVHVKGLSQGDAAALAAEARRMGPHIVHPELRIPATAGWLSQLWAACEANGFRPGYFGTGFAPLL